MPVHRPPGRGEVAGNLTPGAKDTRTVIAPSQVPEQKVKMLHAQLARYSLIVIVLVLLFLAYLARLDGSGGVAVVLRAFADVVEAWPGPEMTPP